MSKTRSRTCQRMSETRHKTLVMSETRYRALIITHQKLVTEHHSLHVRNLVQSMNRHTSETKYRVCHHMSETKYVESFITSETSHRASVACLKLSTEHWSSHVRNQDCIIHHHNEKFSMENQLKVLQQVQDPFT